MRGSNSDSSKGLTLALTLGRILGGVMLAIVPVNLRPSVNPYIDWAQARGPATFWGRHLDAHSCRYVNGRASQ